MALFGFDEHGLTPDKHQIGIKPPEMVMMLTSLYETLHQEEPGEVDVPLCVDLCLNWILNVYDGARTGQIRILSFKLGIVLLCRGPLTEKYLHMYKLVSQSQSKKALLQKVWHLLDLKSVTISVAVNFA